MLLQANELKPFFSEYLQVGYKQDTLALDFIEIDHESIRGHLHVVDHFLPSDGRFHLTVPLAFVWIAQLGIVYACIDNHLTKKEHEIYLREISLTCKRVVNSTQNLKFNLKLMRKIPRTNGVFYRGSIDIEDGSFTGYASFVLPIG